jgi:hypothetical protein
MLRLPLCVFEFELSLHTTCIYWVNAAVHAVWVSAIKVKQTFTWRPCRTRRSRQTSRPALAYDFTDVGDSAIGKRQDQGAVKVDLSPYDRDACVSIFTVNAVLAIAAIFAVTTVGPVPTHNAIFAIFARLTLWALQLLDFIDFCADFGQLFTEQNGDSRQFCFG